MLSFRNLLVVLFFFGFVSAAHSQVLISLLLGDKLNSDKIEFGLDGGFNWSQIGNLDSNSSYRTFNLGFYFDILVDEKWSFNTGVLVKSQLGADKLTEKDLAFLEITPQEEEGNYTQRLSYFLVPALMRYNFPNRIYLEAGPQFGLMYKANVEFNSDIDEGEIIIRKVNKDKINKIDAGVSGGIGYRLSPRKGMSIGMRYYYGFVNTYKDVSGTNNSSLFMKLTIPIGTGGKKTSKKSP
jgi:hypothetical protein